MNLANSRAMFSGRVVRSLKIFRQGQYREYFDWLSIEPDQDDGMTGDLFVDEFTFTDVDKLGSGLVYSRRLPFTAQDQASAYFGGNLEAIEDSEKRTQFRMRDHDVPSEAEQLAIFNQRYPEGVVDSIWGGRDEIWDGARARGHLWFIVRSIAKIDSNFWETLTWIAALFDVTDEQLYERATKNLQAELGSELAVFCQEARESPYVRPMPGMTLFEIGRRSKLKKGDYISRYVVPQ